MKYTLENFRGWLTKNREIRESFPPRMFCRIRYITQTLKRLQHKQYVRTNPLNFRIVIDIQNGIATAVTVSGKKVR